MTTANPFFSIIIPALNEEKYLPLLLSDLSQQTYQNFEVIIVDGQSNDKTIAKSQQFASKLPSLKILISKIKNVSVQRNLGADKAKGEYLVFNDADNRLPTYFLEGLHYRLITSSTDLFTCWTLPDTDKSSDKNISTYYNILIETTQLINQPSAFGALIGCRHSIFGHIRFKPEIGFAEDAQFVRDGCEKGYIYTIFRDPKYIYSLRRFRQHGTIKTLQKYAMLNLKFFTKQKVNQKTEYPMGGHVFSQFPQQLPNISKKPKLLEKIRNILTQLEES